MTAKKLLDQQSLQIIKPNKYSCDLSNCLCVKIIGDVMKLYDCYIRSISQHDQNIHTNIPKIYDTIGNTYYLNYDAVDILNDFNHLLMYHSNQFEDIYNIQINTAYNGIDCDLSKCVCMTRNYRNRSTITKSVERSLYLDSDDMVEQQLLDRIHCYYFHSFHIAYKLTNKEKNNIFDEDTKVADDQKLNNDIYDQSLAQINDVIVSKRQFCSNIVRLHRLNSDNYNSQFATDEVQNKLGTYSYGYRFFYWPYYKNNTSMIDRVNLNSPKQSLENQTLKDWYVEAKYKNLEQELLSNGINHSQLQQLLQKASKHIKSNYFRQMYCPRTNSAENYAMYNCQLISRKHLIGIMVYCNYDIFQHKFSATYRKIDKKETDSDLKKRHSNYYHVGRLLREIVECFGMEYRKDLSIIKLFHGVSQQFTFSSLNAYIKGPFSTTTDYYVALNFCQKTGMILELSMNGFWMLCMENKEALNRGCCFDCSLISDFPNEQEIFCIGGINKFQFETIIHAALGYNFEPYIRGLRTLSRNLNNAKQDINTFNMVLTAYFTPSERDQKIAVALLMHELFRYRPKHPNAHKFNGCPVYFENILRSHCMGIKTVSFNANFNPILNTFFQNNQENQGKWIDLDLLTTMFPNITDIHLYYEHKELLFFEQSTIFESILSYINCKQVMEYKLRAIIIRFNPKHAEKLQDVLQNTYSNQLNKVSWKMKILTGNENNTQKIQKNEPLTSKWKSRVGISLSDYKNIITKRKFSASILVFAKTSIFQEILGDLHDL